jgi:hypothetical protein
LFNHKATFQAERIVSFLSPVYKEPFTKSTLLAWKEYPNYDPSAFKPVWRSKR